MLTLTHNRYIINNFRSVKLYKHSLGQKLAINYVYLDTKLIFIINKRTRITGHKIK